MTSIGTDSLSKFLLAVLLECELSPSLCGSEHPPRAARLCPRLSARCLGCGCDGGSTVCAQQVLNGYTREQAGERLVLALAELLVFGERRGVGRRLQPSVRRTVMDVEDGSMGALGKPRGFLFFIHAVPTFCFPITS